MPGTSTSEDLCGLAALGHIQVSGPFTRPDDAWSAAQEVVSAATIDVPLEVIGHFEVPPPDGPPSRDFQTLHIDFGLPLAPVVAADVARLTALHLPAATAAERCGHATRAVALAAGRRPGPIMMSWFDVSPPTATAMARGQRPLDVEGSLARIVEAALGQTPVLPSVKTYPGFLCGTEFATLADELEFFTQRELPLDAVEIEVCLRPGELLVFDNLLLAHGRRGTRQPGELLQRVFGHRALSVRQQIELRDRVLAAFAT